MQSKQREVETYYSLQANYYSMTSVSSVAQRPVGLCELQNAQPMVFSEGE